MVEPITGHDPLCFVVTQAEHPRVFHPCVCDVIEMTRADERERTFGDAYQQGAVDERERIAQKFESLVNTPGATMISRRLAAQIARGAH